CATAGCTSRCRNDPAPALRGPGLCRSPRQLQDPPMTYADIIRTAEFALRGNWMRSALTSLGVIIGIAAVIVMVSVGHGTQQEIDKLVSGLGSQRLDISPGAGRGPGGARQSASSFYTLTVGDAEAIRDEIPEVQYVAGALRGGTQVVYAENNAATS